MDTILEHVRGIQQLIATGNTIKSFYRPYLDIIDKSFTEGERIVVLRFASLQEVTRYINGDVLEPVMRSFNVTDCVDFLRDIGPDTLNMIENDPNIMYIAVMTTAGNQVCFIAGCGITH